MFRQRTRRRPASEPLEGRALAAVVLILNGNAFGPTVTDAATARLAARLRAAGHRPIQLALPSVTPGLLTQLGRKIERLTQRGQEVAVAGLSAGGTVAARLAMSRDDVVAALDCYGPLDLDDWFAYHEAQGTAFSRSSLAIVAGNLGGNRKTTELLSGPAENRATPIVAAFGERDFNVTVEVNRDSARKSGANIRFLTYAGGHGVGATRAVAAAFVEVLDEVSPPGHEPVPGGPRHRVSSRI